MILILCCILLKGLPGIKGDQGFPGIGLPGWTGPPVN